MNINLNYPSYWRMQVSSQLSRIMSKDIVHWILAFARMTVVSFEACHTDANQHDEKDIYIKTFLIY